MFGIQRNSIVLEHSKHLYVFWVAPGRKQCVQSAPKKYGLYIGLHCIPVPSFMKIG